MAAQRDTRPIARRPAGGGLVRIHVRRDVPADPPAALVAERGAGVGEAAGRLAGERRRCLSLADSSRLTRTEGTAAARDLETALLALETACCTAATDRENP
ncbi:hypothetical protein [Streptomyces specialis]|uniref:hypothetical protein n=1 Tax=Streptomyces specialis TaxID=498367 RepID=UPI00073F70F2|nr:hypothetical protein [Streptomyces specialis]